MSLVIQMCLQEIKTEFIHFRRNVKIVVMEICGVGKGVRE
jgi:hypothetical protein